MTVYQVCMQVQATSTIRTSKLIWETAEKVTIHSINKKDHCNLQTCLKSHTLRTCTSAWVIRFCHHYLKIISILDDFALLAINALILAKLLILVPFLTSGTPNSITCRMALVTYIITFILSFAIFNYSLKLYLIPLSSPSSSPSSSTWIRRITNVANSQIAYPLDKRWKWSVM